MNIVPVQGRDAGPRGESIHPYRFKQVVNEFRKIAVEAGHPKGSIVWPIFPGFNIVKSSDCPRTSSYKAWTSCHSDAVKALYSVRINNWNTSWLNLIRGHIKATVQRSNVFEPFR